MKINKFLDLKTTAQAMKTKSRVAVIEAQDEHTLDAVFEAVRDRIIEATLIGNESEILEILLAVGGDPNAVEIIHSGDQAQSVAKAAELINSGKADILMKGKLETGDMMRAILNKENKLFEPGNILSVVGIYEIPTYPKIFAVSDVALNTYPDLEGKRKILENAVKVLRSIGVENPKVAGLASIEHLNPKMPETVDWDALKQLNLSGEIKNCIFEGPISFDLATDPEAARIKGYESPVAGDADILLVHELTVGNVLVKALTGLGGAKTAGSVVGGKVPIVLTSRSADAEDKYYSIALAACSAGGSK